MKENFDDILKRRWEERSFPIDESHRAEMIELLNNQKRRRAFPFWWIGALAVVMLAGGLLLFTKGGSVSPESLQRSNDEHQATPSGKTEIAAVTGESEIHESESTTSTPSSDAAATKKFSGSTTTTNINSQQKDQIEIASANTSKKSNSNAPLNKNSKNQILPSKEKESASGKNVDNQASDGDASYKVDEDAASSISIVSSPVTVEVEADVETINLSEIEVAQPAANRNIFSSPMISPLLISGIEYEAGDEPFNVEPNKSNSHPFYLFGELGTGLVFASQPDFSSGWKLRAGAGLGYRVGSKMQLTLSGGYLMQHGGFDFERKSTVNVLGFGIRSNFNTLTPKTLHYVYARAGAQYRMHRHIITLHGGVQFLYGAYGTIVTQTEDSVTGGTVSVENDSWVKTDGLQTLLWTGDIAYGYQLTPRLSVMVGTDIIFSSFTVKDPELTQAGYYWKGAFSSLHPFVTLNYLIHGHL